MSANNIDDIIKQVKERKMTKKEIARVRHALKIARFVPGTRKILNPEVRKEVENILSQKEALLDDQQNK